MKNNQKEQSTDKVFENRYNQNVKFWEVEFSPRADISLKQLVRIAYKFGMLQGIEPIEKNP